MIKDRDKITRSTREAADWFVRLNLGTIETEELEAFSAWTKADPQNRAAYDHLDEINKSMVALQDDPDLRAAAAQALARGPERKPARRQGGARRARILAAALAAACVVGAVLGWSFVTRADYVTGVGQTLSARLEDGSRVQLNTDTRLRVRYTRGERRIELMRGQAFFDVAHNAERPFVVEAASAQVRALGTRFDVRKIGQEVRVTLAQGSVEIRDPKVRTTPWRLSPGQALAVTPTAPANVAPKAVDIATATSWTTGKLRFDNVTLAEAVNELNRYSKDKITFADGVPTDHRISGVFSSGDHSDFIAAVSSLYRLDTVRRFNGDLELRPVARPSA
ncbi:FecR family protein [Caulobacter sp. BE254]|uniref:FecR family protein n=1 Tax=Caulobacter sp. BE254 TaxID=2817720 RepID=UPI0028589D3D|nr:FecR family protein [Caulobacter sp. BE254]MDR7117357.1 transmembrane sensor [Caulobacter sp. BE254]